MSNVQEVAEVAIWPTVTTIPSGGLAPTQPSATTSITKPEHPLIDRPKPGAAHRRSVEPGRKNNIKIDENAKITRQACWR
jgi:hypothetical protein